MASLIPALWQTPPDWTQFGGHPDKQNYGDRPVSNPKTQTDAKEYASMALAVGQVSNTSPFAVLNVSLGAATNSLNWYRGQNGIGVAKGPTITETATGVYSIKWPALLTDQAGRSSAPNLAAVVGSIDYQDTAAFAVVIRCRVVAADEIEVKVVRADTNVGWSGLVTLSLSAWSM